MFSWILGLDFFTIPDPWINKAPDSDPDRSATLNFTQQFCIDKLYSEM
jgi:hypothetical protein